MTRRLLPAAVPVNAHVFNNTPTFSAGCAERRQSDGVHENAYLRMVEGQVNLDLLVQQFSSGLATRELAAVDAMTGWLDSGNRPGQSSFPPALGFVRGYVAPAWRW